MQATVYNLAGEEVETIELDDTIFGITPNMAVVNQAVLRQQANARQGTHDTKTRAEVSGGGRKPWRQKGTGRARQGSTRSPQWRHGGVVFGPHPRSYVQDMPRKMRRLAIRSVLSAKAADGRIVVVDTFEEIEPRTKAMVEAMKNLKVDDTALIMTAATENDNLLKAAANLPKIKTMSAHLLSVVDMLKHSYLVMPRASLDVVSTILGTSGGRRKLAIGENGAVEVEEKEAKPRAKAKAQVKAETKAEAKTETKSETKSEAKTETRAKKETKEEAKPEKKTEAKAEAKVTVKEGVRVTGKGPVVISNVHYEGQEYVELRNTGEEAADLGEWTLRDKYEEGVEYKFPAGTELAAGRGMKVYVEPGHNHTFDSNRPILNNEGDAVELLNAKGKVVATYAYGSRADEESEE